MHPGHQTGPAAHDMRAMRHAHKHCGSSMITTASLQPTLTVQHGFGHALMCMCTCHGPCTAAGMQAYLALREGCQGCKATPCWGGGARWQLHMRPLPDVLPASQAAVNAMPSRCALLSNRRCRHACERSCSSCSMTATLHCYASSTSVGRWFASRL